jgi:hypothetical protein
MSSFSRFEIPGSPGNIGFYGYTPEEVQSQQGNPEIDVRVAPMASPAVSDAQLALARSGSDKTRLTRPVDPVANPYEGPKSILSLNRSARMKLRSSISTQLLDRVRVSKDSRRQLMNDSLARANAMTAEVEKLNEWAMFVLVRTAEGRG